MKVDPIKTSFSSGEFGPSLYGRTDIAQYQNACAIVENMLCRPYGSVISTPGTEFIKETKLSALGTSSTVRLIQFIFNRTDAYIIEMGDSYFRFYTDGGVVVSAGTTPYELAHPYSEDELFDVQFAQLNDVIYLAHPNHPPQKLTRLSSNSWTLADFDFLGGPFMDDNDTAITITPSGTNGSITLTLSATSSTIQFVASGSTLGHHGAYFKVGGLVTSSTTGLQVQGYVQITSVSSPTIALATVIQRLSSAAATADWAEGSWSDVRGWPARVTFHERRLFFARTDTEPQTLWGSQPFIYDEFTTGSNDDDALNIKLASNEANEIMWLASGVALAAGTFGGEFIISNGGTGEALTPSNVTSVRHTSWGSESIVPIKIGNFFYYIQRFAKKLREFFYYYDQDTYKSVDKTILSPHITGDGIVDMAYQQNPESILWCVRSDGVLATMTREIDQEVQGWSRQITDGFFESVACIPSQDGPYDEVWVVVRRTIDGTSKRYIERFGDIEPNDRQDLCFYVHSGLTYDAYALTTGLSLSLSATAGTIILTASATSSTFSFSANDVGQRVRAIDADGVMLGEVKITSYSGPTVAIGLVTSAFDALSYEETRWGLSVEEISGLDHLEAAEVVVLADGGLDKPDKVVSSGTIDLAYNYFVVVVGLPYSSTLKTLPFEAGSGRGTAQGKIQRINQIGIKVNNSYKGFQIGDNDDRLQRVVFREPNTSMGTPEELYTGVISNINFPGDYAYGAQIIIKNDDPLPIEILSLMPTLTTEEK